MCTGWKNPNLLAEAKIKEAMANNQPVPQLERKTSCRDCGHEITDHGNLLSLVMPELKRRVILALKINNMMQVRDRDLSREIGLLTECVVPIHRPHPIQRTWLTHSRFFFFAIPSVCRVCRVCVMCGACVCCACVQTRRQLNRVPPPQSQGQPALNPNAMGMQMAQQGGMPPGTSSLPRVKLAPPY